jgi:5'-nucleotidase (lipoprotein e(P4) family)
MIRDNGRRVLRVISLLLLAACADPCIADSSPIPPLRADVKWFRDSAERQMAYTQAYRQAWQSVRSQLSAGVVGQWAVVVDADETVIDNSEFQMRVVLGQVTFTDQTWDGWLTEQAKRAAGSAHEDFIFPQAREFIHTVHAAGGKVIVVTNRLESQCSRTEQVLRGGADKAIEFDAILCAKDGSGKESRFADIQMGRLSKVGPVVVLLFVGDNILDCQGQSQQHYDAAAFGSRCIVLPNPMYGSWTSTPDH